MTRTITQYDLRNNSEAIIQALDRGETFILMRKDIPVGKLTPLKKHFVSRETLLEAFKTAPSINAEQFRSDLNGILNQETETQQNHD